MLTLINNLQHKTARDISALIEKAHAAYTQPAPAALSRMGYLLQRITLSLTAPHWGMPENGTLMDRAQGWECGYLRRAAAHEESCEGECAASR